MLDMWVGAFRMQPSCQPSNRTCTRCTFLAGGSQLPASFFAYRKQQHRWTCGPVQLWRRAAPDIWRSALPLGTKLDLLLVHFGVRKFATHWVSLGFFCTLVPLSIFTPEARACPSTMSANYCLMCSLRLTAFTQDKQKRAIAASSD